MANDYEQNGDKFFNSTNYCFPEFWNSSYKSTWVFTTILLAKGLDSFGLCCMRHTPHALCDTAIAYFYIRGKSNNIAPSLADDFIGTGINQTKTIDVTQNDFDQNGDSLLVIKYNTKIQPTAQSRRTSTTVLIIHQTLHMKVSTRSTIPLATSIVRLFRHKNSAIQQGYMFWCQNPFRYKLMSTTFLAMVITMEI